MTWNDLNPPSLQPITTAPLDPTDVRLHNYIINCHFNLDTLTQIPAQTPCLLGYPDDEGIAANRGRVGASQGPDTIRKHLYKTTWPLSNAPQLFDLGNLNINNSSESLEARHLRAQKWVQKFIVSNPIITLGGGHDYGFPDGAAFIESFPEEPLLIFNFDAHLDVRPTQWGINSGTPFYRLLTQYAHQFHLIEWGLQKQCNSQTYWQWAQNQKNVELVSTSKIRQIGSLPLLKSLLQTYPKNTKCYVTLDIDVFSQGLAPGCSQSWDGGLVYEDVFSSLKWLFEHLDVRIFSIYEVSPQLDRDDQTSKLAAELIHYFLFHQHHLANF